MVHSWNGKHRRPVGLATPDFQEPMRDELLWVYEGLTQYLGFVLAARSGIRTPEEAREVLAGLRQKLKELSRTAAVDKPAVAQERREIETLAQYGIDETFVKPTLRQYIEDEAAKMLKSRER